MAFFIGWELWQELTFVLACLIAIVFLIGFVKLWRTNQILRRYELLDEEKRARLAEMQQYGIDIPAVNDIPFGSRAIQSGIEVDEIWISRPNTPAPSHHAPCTVKIDDSSMNGTTMACKEPSPIGNVSDSSYGKGKVLTPPGGGSSKTPKRSTLSEQHFSDSTTVKTTTLSKGDDNNLLPALRSEGLNHPVNMIDDGGALRPRGSNTQTGSDTGNEAAASALDFETEPVPYGTAEVFANTRTRRTVSGFEILPAGFLGQRFELHASDYQSADLSKPNEEARTPNKLQKPRPKDSN